VARKDISHRLKSRTNQLTKKTHWDWPSIPDISSLLDSQIGYGVCGSDDKGTCVDKRWQTCTSYSADSRCPSFNGHGACCTGWRIKTANCKDIDGKCFDTEIQECDKDFIKRKCPGGKTVVCCPGTVSKKRTYFEHVTDAIHNAVDNVISNLPDTPVSTKTTIQNCDEIPNAKGLPYGPRYQAINTVINAGYKKFAHCFQSLVERATDSSLGNRMPVWFGFAPYASRVVGKGEIALGAMLSALEDEESSIWDLIPAVSLLKGAEHFKDFVMNLVDVFNYGGDSGNMAAMLSVSVLEETVSRAASVVWNKPGDNFLGLPDMKKRAMAMLTDLRAALERGNRLIYQDVGGMSESYLHYRLDRASDPTPQNIFDEFASVVGASTEDCKTMYDYAMAHLDDSPLPVDFDSQLSGSMDSMTAACGVAGLALYEAAAAESDNNKANSYIKFGNNLLAFREQAFAVQPAFNMELAIFEMMTPTVNLKMRGDNVWTYYGYAGDDVINHNWGLFEDRWHPILDAFRVGYESYPGSIWPMPSSDPADD